MDFSAKDLCKLIKDHWVFLFLCAAVSAVCAFSVSAFLVPATYVSSVKLYVYAKSTPEAVPYNSLNDLNYAQKMVGTSMEMLHTDRFYKSVRDNSHLSYSTDELKKMIAFTVLNDTEIFQVSVSSQSPEDAKHIADIIAGLAPDTIRSVQENALLKIVDSPSLPTESSAPNVPLNSVLGFLAGLAFCLFYLLLNQALNLRIRCEEELTARYGIPVLGVIPSFEQSASRYFGRLRKGNRY